MSTNNNNNNNTHPSDEKKKSRKIPAFDNARSEDEEIAHKFVDLVQYKFDNGLMKAPTMKEKKLLQNAILFPGFFIGCFCGVGSFFLLRRGPVAVMNKLLYLRHEHVERYATQITTKAIKRPENFKESLDVKLVGSIFDAAVASMIGFMGWATFLSKTKLFNTLADMPLIEGKSEISNSLCNDFINIHKNETRSRFWKENTDETICSINKFVKNCEKRHLYQKKIRRDMGLASSGEGMEEMELPSSVPEDFLEDVDQLDDWAALEDVDEDNFDGNNN